MNHAQYNYVETGLRALAVVAVILAVNPASAGRITQPAKPNPLLDGGDTSRCMAGADLAGGTDATGKPVIPADVGAPPTPVPDEIMVPLGGSAPAQPSFGGQQPNPSTGVGGGLYAGFDGRRMAPLLNPKPCPR